MAKFDIHTWIYPWISISTATLGKFCKPPTTPRVCASAIDFS